MLILQPMLAMFLLTFAVWTHLYVTRIGFLRREHVRTETLKTPRAAFKVIPDEVNLPAYNLNNLVELPVVFYALCLLLYVSGLTDLVYLVGAWAFVVFRALHSLVHCTFNHVMLRFSLYMLSSIALWFMVIRAALHVFGGTS